MWSVVHRAVIYPHVAAVGLSLITVLLYKCWFNRYQSLAKKQVFEPLLDRFRHGDLERDVETILAQYRHLAQTNTLAKLIALTVEHAVTRARSLQLRR